jgi:predicted DNA-binding transcriptional regulator AlpA
MLKIIKEKLLQIIQDIDAGNSNIDENEAIEIAKVIQSYTDKTQRISKYKACEYLNVSRATFDNYVREGKLPKGKKEAGFKELFWSKKDLDTFKEKMRDKNLATNC